MLQLYNTQQSAEATDQKLKKLEVDYRKAIQMIQGFVKRHEQLEDKHSKKDRRIMELEVELSKLRNENAKATRSTINSSVRRNLSNELVDGPERDHNGQVCITATLNSACTLNNLSSMAATSAQAY